MGLDTLLNNSKITCYIGYDATASSLHVGHLMNIMMLTGAGDIDMYVDGGDVLWRDPD